MPQPHSTSAPPSYSDAPTYPPSSAAPSKPQPQPQPQQQPQPQPQPPSAPTDYSSYAPSYAKPGPGPAPAASTASPAGYPPRHYFPPSDFAYPPAAPAKPPSAEFYGRAGSAGYAPNYGNRPNFAPYASNSDGFDAPRQNFARPPQRAFPAGEFQYPYPAGNYPQPAHSSFSHGKEPEPRAADPPRKGRFDAFPPNFPPSLEKPCASPRV